MEDVYRRGAKPMNGWPKDWQESGPSDWPGVADTICMRKAAPVSINRRRQIFLKGD
jgi:hypothetical protein